MLDLARDLVALFGLMAAAVGACGVALVLAKQLGLDAQFLRYFNAGPRNPERTLELMIECADVAAREGLLKLEAHIARLDEPLLARGVSLALEGRAERDMRKELDHAIQTSAESGAARARLLATTGMVAQAAGILIALGLLIACLALASGLSGALPGILLLLGGATALLAIVAGSLWSESAGMGRAADALCDLIIAEGILLVRSGRDARSVAQTLSRYVPPPAATHTLARAA